MEYEDHMLELVDFFKEMGIESKFKDGILYIGIVPIEVKDDLEKILYRESLDLVLWYGKYLKVKFL